MQAFRIFLGVYLIGLAAYTGVVIANHGWGLFQIFFGDIAAMGWPGQFNADFMGFLLLSGLWLAWRHNFSPLGLVLLPCGLFGGMGFLAPYLLVASFQAKGDMRAILLGPTRARG